MKTGDLRIRDRDRDIDPQIRYKKNGEAWHINTVAIDGRSWRPYAHKAASEQTVRQLIRKDYDPRY